MRKKISVEVLSLIGSGKLIEATRFFDPECKPHNPYTSGGMNELTDAMIKVQNQAFEGILIGSKADFKLKSSRLQLKETLLLCIL